MAPPKGQIIRKPRFGEVQHASAVQTLDLIERNMESLDRDVRASYPTTSGVFATVDSARRRVGKLRKQLDLDFRDRFGNVPSPYYLTPQAVPDAAPADLPALPPIEEVDVPLMEVASGTESP